MKQNDVTLHPVDQLGQIRAEIAQLRTQERALEIEIAKGPAGTREGVLFDATVSKYDRETTAWKEVAQHFNPSVQLVTAHTSKTPVTQIRLTAKKKGA